MHQTCTHIIPEKLASPRKFWASGPESSLKNAIFVDEFVSDSTCRTVGDVRHCYTELPPHYTSAVLARTACPAESHLVTITSRQELQFVFPIKSKIKHLITESNSL